MNFWNEHVRPARGSVIARCEWDGPLLEREVDDIASELAMADREEQNSGVPR
jgi:hypothetical protein